ncbi:DUF2937 family protein [Celeribacter sp.]|uniref:DUF2937 family protein n=1 Tax=Celeribacter sp. TaxID=1890673 RepID=UPI003A8CE575
MIFKVLTLVGGLFGAALVSQFPEFTQQYTQRLGGQVEALGVVLADFDHSAQRADMTRDEALASMGGTVFMENRRRDMRRTIDRHARLSADQIALRTATPLQRLTMPHRVADTELARSTWNDFVPAMPLSVAGIISGFVGFIGGYVVIAAFLRFLAWPFRKRRKKANGLTFTS